MIDDILKKPLKWTAILSTLSAIAFLFVNPRISAGIGLGLAGVAIYCWMLSNHAQLIDPELIPPGGRVPRRSFLRILVLGVVLFVSFWFSNVFHWAGTFGVMLVFHVMLIIGGYHYREEESDDPSRKE